jgi:hypothetical protein
MDFTIRHSERINKHETLRHRYTAPLIPALPLDGIAPLGERCLNRDRVRADYVGCHIGRNVGPRQSGREFAGCAIADAGIDDGSNHLSGDGAQGLHRPLQG